MFAYTRTIDKDPRRSIPYRTWLLWGHFNFLCCFFKT